MIDALGISLKEFIFYLCNFIILIVVLGKFLYKPFLNMLAKRTETIRSTLENAAETNRLADEKLANYELRIANVESEGREIIKDATEKAKAQANTIIAEANEKASEIVEKARREVEQEKANALADMRAQIGSLALVVAEKVMEKDIEVNGQEAILDQVMKEVGTSKWQN